MKIKILIPAILLASFFLTISFNGCSNNNEELGVGPVKEVKLDMGKIDDKMSASGKTIFEQKCVSCHKIDEKLIGPPLKGVTKRRKPEWIMNMILNPEGMVKENQAAASLFAEYKVPMVSQNLTQDEARNVLEYFRSVDK
ncbi:MAG: cytochrome c [Bacteroidetes bacterium]|nr:cytochrome c [Bacteroidota bacterium]